MDKLLLFIKPWLKKLSIQLTWNSKPFDKPLKYYVIKLGYRFYLITAKPKFKISCIGTIRYPPHIKTK